MSAFTQAKFSFGIDGESVVIKILTKEGGELCMLNIPEREVDEFIRRLALMREVIRSLRKQDEEER